MNKLVTGIRNFSNTGFVIRTQQRRATGSDQVIADLCAQLGVVGHPDDLCRIIRQRYILSLVILMHERLHTASAAIGCRIHMRTKTNHRDIGLVAICGYCRIHITKLIQMCVL